MLYVLLACTTPSTPEPPPPADPMPYEPLAPGQDLAGQEFGVLAGEGDAIPVPPTLEPEALAFRNDLVEHLLSAGTLVVPSFGRFERTGENRHTSVVFRADPAVRATLRGQPTPAAAPSDLWAFVLRETATHAVYVDRVGWFGQKTLPAFSAGGRDVPETTTLYFRPDTGLIAALRLPLPG
ncbi:MAG: hypothetical protein R3F61_35770 [Myxococcota bacterium]